jgi:hypothetical protein
MPASIYRDTAACKPLQFNHLDAFVQPLLAGLRALTVKSASGVLL